ncbi:MAG: tetratricopeptide repeat protein [Pedobacter sp.]|nr:MAG: tetratricopeptide repeat protein [Pedobacter sp.]
MQTEIYKRNGNMEALVMVFDQLILLDSDVDSYFFDKANALVISGKPAEAQKIYAEIEQKFGSSKELEMAKQRVNVNGSNAAQVVEKLIAESPAEAKNYLYLSGLLIEKNKVDEAYALLQKAKVAEPDNYEVDLALADIYRMQQKNELLSAALKSAFSKENMPIATKIKIVAGMLTKSNATKQKDAGELIQLALQAHPGEQKLLILYGDVLYQQGNLKAAKEQYQAVLKNDEQTYIAWEKILGIQTLMGNYAEAIKTGDDALAIYPNQAILYYYKAFALHRNGQNAEAGLEIKSALQLDGDDNNLKALIFALQAEVLIDQQKLKEADVAFDKAVTLAPDNYLTLSNYAYYLALRNQDLVKAESLVAKAAKAMPKNASIADTYAIVLFKQGKYAEALTYIEKALQNNEALNPVYLEHYGDILFQKGDAEMALTQWQKAKQAGNDSEKLKRKINEKKYIK